MKKRGFLRILVHQPRLSYYIGGGEIVAIEQAGFLSNLGHQVEILTSQPPRFSSVFESFRKTSPQIKIHFLKLLPKQQEIYNEVPGKNWSRWDKEAIFFGQKAMEFYLDSKNSWDIVVTHLLSDGLFIPRAFTNILRLHGVPSKKRTFDEIFLDRPDGFVADSQFVKKGWLKLYPFLKKKDIQVGYNGINTKKFPCLNLKRDIDFLYVGRFLKTKGIFNILKAVSILQMRGIFFNKLLMVGRGPELKEVTKMINSLGLKDKIQITEFVPHEELVNLCNQAKIFLCPSYAKEGVLTTMLEAASCGAAIITADCCGMVEFAKDRINALVIKPQDNQELAQSMATLLEQKDIREKLAKKAGQDVVANWDITKTGKKLEKLYCQFFKQRGGQK